MKESVSVMNCVFDGFASVAFPLRRNQSAEFKNCTFKNSSSIAFRITDVQETYFWNCSFLNLTSGSWIVSRGKIYAKDCLFSFALAAQIAFSSTGLDSVSITIDSCAFNFNNGLGLFSASNPGPFQKLFVENSTFFNYSVF